MSRFIILGPNILSESNATVFGVFCAKYDYKIIQAGTHPLPYACYQMVFIDMNLAAIELVHSQKDNSKLGYHIQNGEDLDALNAIFADIERRWHSPKVAAHGNGLHNGSAKTDFFASNKKGEEQPLLKSTKSDAQKTIPGCCAVM